MCFFSTAKGREQRKRPLSQDGRETVHQKPRALSFPRDAHYANGQISLPFIDGIRNVISFPSESKGGALRQRRRHGNALLRSVPTLLTQQGDSSISGRATVFARKVLQDRDVAIWGGICRKLNHIKI